MYVKYGAHLSQAGSDQRMAEPFLNWSATFLESYQVLRFDIILKMPPHRHSNTILHFL